MTKCPECKDGRLKWCGDYDLGLFAWGCTICDFATKDFKIAHPAKWRAGHSPIGTLWDRKYYPARWNELRKKILTRDKNLCRIDGCPSLLGLDVHHIDGNEFNMDERNLITLCDQHHAETQAELRKRQLVSSRSQPIMRAIRSMLS